MATQAGLTSRAVRNDLNAGSAFSERRVWGGERERGKEVNVEYHVLALLQLNVEAEFLAGGNNCKSYINMYSNSTYSIKYAN